MTQTNEMAIWLVKGKCQGRLEDIVEILTQLHYHPSEEKQIRYCRILKIRLTQKQ